jgi:hypothetical protein
VTTLPTRIIARAVPDPLHPGRWKIRPTYVQHGQALDPLPPPRRVVILPPTLSGAAWWAIAAVIAVALLILSGCAGPSDDRGPSSPQGSPVVAARFDPHASWCGESCRDLPSLGVGPRVARRGSR